jgi:hypothetical protein
MFNIEELTSEKIDLIVCTKLPMERIRQMSKETPNQNTFFAESEIDCWRYKILDLIAAKRSNKENTAKQRGTFV